ncbi:imelysin family protein [Winogradskyella aurantiaca]|uniref:imelysin family protein n=1 Tax=Winogradskyella aurantiaca TaxID=2219558 RepID=UPI000E1C9330|nr:imelysin family protein [Winogradskyella aurantiaca]
MKKLSSILIMAILIVACSSSDEGYGGGNENPSFDQVVLLSNLADNLIIPSFNQLQTQLSAFDVARAGFINDRTQENLNALSSAWQEAYMAWQHVEMFNIGEAELQAGNPTGFVSFFNIYPVTVSDIKSAAEGNSYDLNSSFYHDAQGFPALDYLIHGIAEGDTTPLDKFTSNENFEGYIEFLTNVTSQMMAKNNAIINSWTSTYRDAFVSNMGSTATSSFNKIVNDYIYYYEKGLRAAKIGIPAGNFSNTPLPEKVEAYYKQDLSRTFALEALDAVIEVFNGSNGSGFADYLDFLDRSDLKIDIQNQFAEARTKIQGLNLNFYQQVQDDNTKMTEAYDALQAAVVLLKVDMVSAFSVSIDYVDADGD